MEKDYNSPYVLKSLIKRDAKNGDIHCHYCLRVFSANMDGFANMAIDHLVPQSKGGGHDLSNLVISCKFCNSAKGNKDLAGDNIFTRERQVIRDLDDEWVKSHLFRYAILDQIPNTKRLVEEMINALSKQVWCKEVRSYSRDPDKWIEWKGSHDLMWYLNLEGFYLQPNWLMNNQDSIDPIELYKIGFRKNFLFYAILSPFCNSVEGVEFVKSKVDDYYRWYEGRMNV
jgi:hypothetical protein